MVKTDIGTYTLQGQELYLDGKLVPLHGIVPAKSSSLSIVNDVIYIHTAGGLMRLTNEEAEPLFLDIMDYSLAGLRSILYINGTNLYSAQSTVSASILAENVTKNVYAVLGNHFYFITNDVISCIDLTTEEITSLQEVTSPVTLIKISGDKLIFITIDGDVVVDAAS